MPTPGQVFSGRKCQSVASCFCVTFSVNGSSKEHKTHFVELPSEGRAAWKRSDGPFGSSQGTVKPPGANKCFEEESVFTHLPRSCKQCLNGPKHLGLKQF